MCNPAQGSGEVVSVGAEDDEDEDEDEGGGGGERYIAEPEF